MSNKIIDFYVLNTGAPFTWGDFYSWDSKILEEKHDYIQWLFPLAEKSHCQPDTPFLDGLSVLAIKNNPGVFKQQQNEAFEKMARFYGFEYNPVTKEMKDCKRQKKWISAYNHNYLRITRILKSLVLFGNVDMAKRFYLRLIEMEELEGIPMETIKFWHDAVYASPY